MPLESLSIKDSLQKPPPGDACQAWARRATVGQDIQANGWIVLMGAQPTVSILYHF